MALYNANNRLICDLHLVGLFAVKTTKIPTALRRHSWALAAGSHDHHEFLNAV